MTDTDQKLEDDVLRRMLATKPRPHKAKGGKPKPAEINSGGVNPIVRLRDTSNSNG